MLDDGMSNLCEGGVAGDPSGVPRHVGLYGGNNRRGEEGNEHYERGKFFPRRWQLAFNSCTVIMITLFWNCCGLGSDTVV